MIDRQADAWVLGIDTSAYTTSVAAVFDSGISLQERQVLPVELGSRGLRPSEALFHHIRALPNLVESLVSRLNPREMVGVAVSVAPRPQEGSYLPPFLAGEAVARSLAAHARVPCLSTTHQEGHIRAGLAGSGLIPDDAFLALHVSGGTTELVRVQWSSRDAMQVRLVGGSDDLYAGQFVDRVGVLLGCRFPAGPELDQLAEAQEDYIEIPWSRPRFRDNLWWISFSGPESAAERAMLSGAAAGLIARGVMESIAQSLAALVQAAQQRGDLLVVGGVAANTHLRRRMRSLLEPKGWRIWFAEPDWSRDNAIGVGYLGIDAWRRRDDVLVQDSRI